MNKNDEAVKKFESCKNSDGYFCFRKVKLLGFIPLTASHNVGVNGYSIVFHCGDCKRWEKRE